jgi:hypothetical protein
MTTTGRDVPVPYRVGPAAATIANNAAPSAAATANGGHCHDSRWSDNPLDAGHSGKNGTITTRRRPVSR